VLGCMLCIDKSVTVAVCLCNITALEHYMREDGTEIVAHDVHLEGHSRTFPKIFLAFFLSANF